MIFRFNKSGQLKLAEVDEPRFERDGLLIEGQRTNYLRNSNKPDSWTVHSALNKTFGTDKQGFNYATVTPTESIVGTTGGYTVHGVVAADRFPLASGECFTFSCRVKGAKARCRLRVSVIIGGTDTFSADSYLDLDTRIATVSGNTSLITAKAEQQGEWTYYEATYTANTDIDTVNCAFYMTNKISNEPFYDDSTLTMTTPQIELGNTASSFIVTTMPTTRASDVVTIPSANNLSTRPFTVLCEVRRNWSTPPNVAPRIFDVGGHSIDDNYLSLGFVSTGKISANVGMVQPQISSDGERFIVGVRAKSDLSVNAICNGNYTTNLNGKIFGVTATSYRFGGQTAAGTRHLFGHIRNFRESATRSIMTAKDLAYLIKFDGNYKDGMTVWLFSCNTGKGQNSFASQLAKELHTNVIGPDTLWTWWGRGTNGKLKMDTVLTAPTNLNSNKDLMAITTKDLGNWITYGPSGHPISNMQGTPEKPSDIR